jgi:hypothetical protein
MCSQVSPIRACEARNDGHDFSADFLCVNIIEFRAQARLMPGFAKNWSFKPDQRRPRPQNAVDGELCVIASYLIPRSYLVPFHMY